MDGRFDRYRMVVAGAAVVTTVALAAVIVQGGRADDESPVVASTAPSTSARIVPRPPVLATPPKVTPALTPLPSPSDTVASPEWTQIHLSTRYRYSIRYPFGWRPEHAASDQDADTLTAPEPSTTRLSILRRDRTPGAALERDAERWLPPRHAATGGCRWPSGIIYIPGGDIFHETSIDGHPALIRSECSVVDAAIDLGDDAMLIVLRSQRKMPTGDRATFDQFASTLAITVPRDGPIATPHPQVPVPAATPEPTQAVMFVSPRFGYAIAHPADWRVDEFTDGFVHDELRGPGAQRMTIRTESKPRTTTAGAWANAQLGSRVTGSDPDSTGCHWSGGTIFIPRPPAPFETTKVGGRPAVVRSECGYVDGVVDLGDRVLILAFNFTAHRADGDRAAFDGLVAGLRILSRN